MPGTSTNFLVCPFPFVCDLYGGCSHGCKYCYANAMKRGKERAEFSQKIERADTLKSVERFVSGEKSKRDSWCDWDPPLRFGIRSDPFQPAEQREGLMLAAMKMLAKRGYPFIIVTKGTDVLSAPEYLAVLKDCNCVVNVSMSSPAMDALEPGAPPYERRLAAVEALAKVVPRVVARWQPFLMEHTGKAIAEIPRLKSAGAHAVLVEPIFGSKFKIGSLMVKVRQKYLYPVDVVERSWTSIRAAAHANGLVFVTPSIRKLSDSLLCCTGGEMPGFVPNTCNATFYYAAPEKYKPTERMKQVGTGDVFNLIRTGRNKFKRLGSYSFAQLMTHRSKTQFSREEILDR